MSALGIGLAWAALASAAFMALSATALARSHRELEVAPGPRGDGGPAGFTGYAEPAYAELLGSRVEDLILPAAHALAARSPRSRARAHWPAPAHTTTMLRSSPSVTHMTASPGRLGSVHLR